MRTLKLALVLGLTLAVTACSKPTQEKTSQDLKAAGSEIGDAAKAVVATPEMKAVGADIKQGAAEAGDKLKAGAEKAGDKLQAGAKKAGDKTEAALNDAKAKTEK